MRALLRVLMQERNVWIVWRTAASSGRERVGMEFEEVIMKGVGVTECEYGTIDVPGKGGRVKAGLVTDGAQAYCF